jgi:TPP-dependent pyruvate/acetoin dehydrogenase alpha subunit
VAQAIEESERTPPLTPGTMFEDVYKEMPPHLREQRDALLAHLEKRNPTRPA